jgi:hypothetical protein
VGAAQAGAGFAGAAAGNAAGGGYKTALDVTRTGKLTLGGSTGSLLQTGAKTAAEQGTGLVGTLAAPGSQEPRQDRTPVARQHTALQESDKNPAWMNAEIKKEREFREQTRKGLAGRAAGQTSGLLNDTNRVSGKLSQTESQSGQLDTKVKSEAAKKGNPSDIQDADKENTKGIKETMGSGSESLKSMAENLKDGVKLAQKLGKAS